MAMKSVWRGIKETANNYTLIEKNVRDATTNEYVWASDQLKAKIAKATYDQPRYLKLRNMLYKRLNHHAYPLHCYKALILLEYLLKNGAKRFISDARSRELEVSCLKGYQISSEKDQYRVAGKIRDLASKLLDMLKDPQKLKEEREGTKNIQGYSNETYSSKRGNKTKKKSKSKKKYISSSSDNYESDSEPEELVIPKKKKAVRRKPNKSIPNDSHELTAIEKAKLKAKKKAIRVGKLKSVGRMAGKMALAKKRSTKKTIKKTTKKTTSTKKAKKKIPKQKKPKKTRQDDPFEEDESADPFGDAADPFDSGDDMFQEQLDIFGNDTNQGNGYNAEEYDSSVFAVEKGNDAYVVSEESEDEDVFADSPSETELLGDILTPKKGKRKQKKGKTVAQRTLETRAKALPTASEMDLTDLPYSNVAQLEHFDPSSIQAMQKTYNKEYMRRIDEAKQMVHQSQLIASQNNAIAVYNPQAIMNNATTYVNGHVQIDPTHLQYQQQQIMLQQQYALQQKQQSQNPFHFQK